jgi:hypothetical protein
MHRLMCFNIHFRFIVHRSMLRRWIWYWINKIIKLNIASRRYSLTFKNNKILSGGVRHSRLKSGTHDTIIQLKFLDIPYDIPTRNPMDFRIVSCLLIRNACLRWPISSCDWPSKIERTIVTCGLSYNRLPFLKWIDKAAWSNALIISLLFCYCLGIFAYCLYLPLSWW